jgi:hypothetical protein
VTCSARISTNVTANAVGTGPAGTRPASTGPASTAPLGPSGPQVTRRPVGGVQTGGGSTAGLEHRGPLVLGVTLLLAAGLLQNRAARRRQR